MDGSDLRAANSISLLLPCLAWRHCSKHLLIGLQSALELLLQQLLVLAGGSGGVMEEFSEEFLAHFGVVGGPEDVVVPGLIDGLGGDTGEVGDLAEVEELLVLLHNFVSVLGAPALLTGQLSLKLVFLLGGESVDFPVGDLLKH